MELLEQIPGWLQGLGSGGILAFLLWVINTYFVKRKQDNDRDADLLNGATGLANTALARLDSLERRMAERDAQYDKLRQALETTQITLKRVVAAYQTLSAIVRRAIADGKIDATPEITGLLDIEKLLQTPESYDPSTTVNTTVIVPHVPAPTPQTQPLPVDVVVDAAPPPTPSRKRRTRRTAPVPTE